MHKNFESSTLCNILVDNVKKWTFLQFFFTAYLQPGKGTWRPGKLCPTDIGVMSVGPHSCSTVRHRYRGIEYYSIMFASPQAVASRNCLRPNGRRSRGSCCDVLHFISLTLQVFLLPFIFNSLCHFTSEIFRYRRRSEQALRRPNKIDSWTDMSIFDSHRSITYTLHPRCTPHLEFLLVRSIDVIVHRSIPTDSSNTGIQLLDGCLSDLRPFIALLQPPFAGQVRVTEAEWNFSVCL